MISVIYTLFTPIEETLMNVDIGKADLTSMCDLFHCTVGAEEYLWGSKIQNVLGSLNCPSWGDHLGSHIPRGHLSSTLSCLEYISTKNEAD